MNKIRNDSLFFVACLMCLYLIFWLARAVTDWGQNMGVRCEVGYDPVTSMCADIYPSKRRAWDLP